MAAQGNTTVTVTVADLPQVRAALAGAVEACVSQRRVLLTAIQGSCACENCKAFLVDLLSAPDQYLSGTSRRNPRRPHSH